VEATINSYNDTIDVLAKSLTEYLEADQVNLIKRAYYYAEQAHDGQLRISGSPYVTHPLAVAGILREMHMDHQSVAAAMLHDVIEDTGLTKEAISSQFGSSVADIVDGVSKLIRIEFSTHAEAQAENFQKMALAMAKDIRVILVKLADRMHNMRTLSALKPEKQRRIARETLDIYAPIANRLGMNNMRIEFEERGFAALYPMRARRLEAAVKSIAGNRKEIVQQIENALTACLQRENLPGRVVGREKHIYSIIKKCVKSAFLFVRSLTFLLFVLSPTRSIAVIGFLEPYTTFTNQYPDGSRTISPYRK